MLTGIVVRVVAEKGFGFLMGDDKLERFFHKSQLLDQTTWPIRENTRVSFEHLDNDKGPRAAKIAVIP